MLGRRGLLKRGAGAAAGIVAAGGIVRAVDVGSKPSVTVITPLPSVAMFLIDRSGSMIDLRQATVDGINKLLDEQRDKADLLISILQFDTTFGSARCEITETCGFVPASQAPILTEADYVPRGSTPLLGAVVEAISRLEKMPAIKRLLVVQTDGYENASPPEITKQVVKEMIKAKEAEGNWTFAFMGANIDAWGEGGSMGIVAGNTMQYANTAAGTNMAYLTTSGSTTAWYNSATTATGNFYVQLKDDEPKA